MPQQSSLLFVQYFPVCLIIYVEIETNIIFVWLSNYLVMTYVNLFTIVGKLSAKMSIQQQAKQTYILFSVLRPSASLNFLSTLVPSSVPF